MGPKANLSFLVLLGLLATSPRLSAQSPPPPEQQDNQTLLADVEDEACKQALLSCKNDDKLLEKWQQCRASCQKLIHCKRDCRASMRDDKGDIRDEFRACKDACKGKKSCEKKCREEKRSDKKEARHDKRDCKADCRDAAKTPECRQARLQLTNALLACAGKAGPACVASLKNALSDGD